MLKFSSLISRALLGLSLAGMVVLPALALEKEGMPDIGQEEQTCLPTSTANLIVWFGLHGYPKLIKDGDSDADNYAHTVHALMTAVNATYQLGTRTEAITYGIGKYIRDAGYGCDVEYRGVDWSQAKFPDIIKDPDEDKYKVGMKTPAAFSQDWLKENDEPNKGFILLLAFTKFDRATNSFSDAIHAGHAVTLVNAEPDMILIHDPAHYDDGPGRKILTPEVLSGGTFELPGYAAPVSGLLLLTGTQLELSRETIVMLTGAVCVTMHSDKPGANVIATTAGAPNSIIGGTTPTDAPATPVAPVTSPDRSWTMWLFSLLFGK